MTTLGTVDLLLASALVLLVGILSVAYRLDINRDLGLAVARMLLQVAAAGLVLKLAIEQQSPLLSAGLAVLIVALAAYDLTRRQRQSLGGWRTFLLGSGALLIAGLCVSVFALAAVIGAKPWYAPGYALPILGMLVANALVGVRVALDAMLESIRRERVAIEGRLALGESRLRALGYPLRQAMHAGLTPVIGTIGAAGAVSMPAMMSGLVLAGMDPVEAAKYQAVILLAIAAATALAVWLTTLGAALLLTDRRHRLRLERVSLN